MIERLPVAGREDLALHARLLARRHRLSLFATVALHATAASAGLVAPLLLGELVQSVTEGTTTAYVDEIVLVLAGFLLVQTVVTWLARRASFVLSETIFAELARTSCGECSRSRSRPWSGPGPATSSPGRPRTSTRSRARSGSPCPRR